MHHWFETEFLRTFSAETELRIMIDIYFENLDFMALNGIFSLFIAISCCFEEEMCTVLNI